jgi:hypothetical protein
MREVKENASTRTQKRCDVFGAGVCTVHSAGNSHSFPLIVSPGARTCLRNAHAQVDIISQTPDGQAEDMFIVAIGLPANTGFDFFVIQVPNAPFGLSWYQGDMQTDSGGIATQHFRGRFSIET